MAAKKTPTRSGANIDRRRVTNKGLITQKSKSKKSSVGSKIVNGIATYEKSVWNAEKRAVAGGAKAIGRGAKAYAKYAITPDKWIGTQIVKGAKKAVQPVQPVKTKRTRSTSTNKK